MERRILGALLSLAHFFIAIVGVALVGIVFWAAVEIVRPEFVGSSFWVRSLPFLGAFLVLTLWWLALLFWAFAQQRRITIASMEGRHAEANERARRFRDHETLLRLLGLNGAVWRRADVVEAYAHYLHGIYGEAIALALPAARGVATPLKRSAALVAASAAADMGNLAVFEELKPWLDRAHAAPRRPFAQQLLAVEGIAMASQLRLDVAEARAEEVLAIDPRARLALALRSQVRGLKGEFAAALADAEAAIAAIPAKGPAAQRVFMRQVLDTSRGSLLRELGRMDEALAIVRRIAEEGPRHRTCAIAVPAVEGMVAAAKGDGAGAEVAISALRALAGTWEFDPVARGRVALAVARIELARGRAEQAAAALGDAVASPLAAIRQEALVLQARAKAAMGDAAGGRAACEWALQLSAATVHAARARELLAGGASARV